MNKTKRIKSIAILAGMLAAATWAASGVENADETRLPEQGARSKERRDAMFEQRMAKLPPEQQRLHREMRPLRDSMMRLTRDYRRKAKDGTPPRSLTQERAAILALEGKIQMVQAENREAWLDMLARGDGPMGPGGPMRHRRHHHKDDRAGEPPHPECPMTQDDDKTPPSPED